MSYSSVTDDGWLTSLFVSLANFYLKLVLSIGLFYLFRISISKILFPSK